MPVNWDIRLDQTSLRFDYKDQPNKITFHSGGGITAQGTVNAKTFRNQNNSFRVNEEGHLVATSFSGDGSGLDNVSPWEEKQNSNDIYYNTGNGNVGIGTDAPNVKLDVEGKIRTNDNDIYLRSGADNNHGLGWYGTNTNKFANTELDGPVVYGNSKGALGTRRGAGDTENIALTWKHNGYVGIGTSNPTAKLEVYAGDILLTASANDPGDIVFRNSGGDQFGRIWTYYNSGEPQLRLSGGENDGNISPDIVINKNGDVGIGTTSPSKLLSVGEHFTVDAAGNVVATSFSGGGLGIWEEKQNSDDIYYNTGDGNVGIGTSNPTEKLEVKNGSIFIHGTSGGQGRLVLKKDGGGDQFEWYPQNTGLYLYNRTSGDHNMHIRNDGNIVIYKELWVKEDIWIQGFKPTHWGDFVFESDYNLMPLTELQTYIAENKHLPEVPSAEKIGENGFKLAEMDALQMLKIEELTLYILQLQEQITEMQTEINQIKN